MTSLIDRMSVEQQSNEVMLETAAAFYQELYTAQLEDPEAMQ